MGQPDPTVIMADQALRLIALWAFQALVQGGIVAVLGAVAYRLARRKCRSASIRAAIRRRGYRECRSSGLRVFQTRSSASISHKGALTVWL